SVSCATACPHPSSPGPSAIRKLRNLPAARAPRSRSRASSRPSRPCPDTKRCYGWPMSTDRSAAGGSRGMTLRLADGMESIPAHEWDGLEATRRLPGRPYNPFISRNFLLALEKSGSATARTGWSPCHLLLETGAGELAGAAPCYLKSHSQGEYVFDHGWANAFERAGGQYYPKLQVAEPFTPAAGPRLLVAAGRDRDPARIALADGLRRFADRIGVSSAHVTFAPRAEAETLERCGYLIRNDQQFHFHNRGFATYGEFLDSLALRKRKALRK